MACALALALSLSLAPESDMIMQTALSLSPFLPEEIPNLLSVRPSVHPTSVNFAFGAAAQSPSKICRYGEDLKSGFVKIFPISILNLTICKLGKELFHK